MPTDVIMPALGMAQETGRLLAWHKREGEAVARGEPLFEVETDKLTVEIEAPASGVLTWVRAMAGDDIPVGQAIAIILSHEEVAEVTGDPIFVPPSTEAPSIETPPATTPAVPQIVASPVAQRIAAEHGVDLRAVRPNGGRVLKEDVLAYLQSRPARLLPASPKARRLAAEQGVDLGALRGSGPDGAVLAADVLAYQPPTAPAATAPLAAPTPPAPLAPPAAPTANWHGPAEHALSPQPPALSPQPPALSPQPSALSAQPSTPSPQPSSFIPHPSSLIPSLAWRVMAERLTQSWTTVPHFYLVREVEATGLLAWHGQARARSAVKVTISDALVLLVAAALRAHPQVNGGWADGHLLRNERVNVGFAVAVDDGLLVPVIHDADRLRLGQIAARRADLVARAQARQLRPDDLRDGTFTISNLGMFGVDAFNAIVNPPQAAILAVGRVAERVVPVAGQPGVRPMLTLTLSCDHRAVDGARAARFLDALAALIEDPLRALE